VPRIAPFEALVYDVDRAGPIDRLTAPPYDVISASRRRSFVEGSPYSIVHVDLADAPVGTGADDGAPAPYERAGAELRRWVAEGLLRRRPSSYYAYEMRPSMSAGPPVRGLLCAMDLEPWGGSIVPHEQVMDGPVADRLALLRATHTHLSAIYGVVDGVGESFTGALDDAARGGDALFAMRDDEGVEHVVRSVPANPEIADAVGARSLLIADGHHRYTTALAYREERDRWGSGGWDRVLTFVVDAGADGLAVRPYHRIQRRGTVPENGEPVPDLATVLAAVDDDHLRYGTVRRGRDVPTYALHRVEGAPPTVEALHERLLDRTAPGDALAFTPSAEDADAEVRAGRAVAAYLLPSTTARRIRAVVDAGRRLPRKSTFFWPKPRTGMVLMPLDPAATTG
jgi:uncharacterized protein (DUF1015 family)